MPWLLVLPPPARRPTLRLEWPFWNGTAFSKPFNGSSTASRKKARFLKTADGSNPTAVRPLSSAAPSSALYSSIPRDLRFPDDPSFYTFELTLRLKRSPAPYPKPLAPSYFETNGSLLWAAFSGFFPSSAGIGTTPWCLLTFRVNLYCETSHRITTTHSSTPVDQGVLRAGTQPALFFFLHPH